MYFTNQYYCKCGFEQFLTEGGHEKVVQCQECFMLQEAEVTQTYLICCKECGKEDRIEEGVPLEGLIACWQCQKAGTLDFKQDGNALFWLKPVIQTHASCSKCKGAIDMVREEAKCPACHAPSMKMKMSNAWE